MNQPRKKARNPRVTPHERGTGGQPTSDEESLIPDEPERTRADPDGRTPPDHQRDTRTEGRSPEQKIVEEAREGQAPPINRDETDEDRTTEG